MMIRLVVALFALASASAFAPVGKTSRSSTSLQATNDKLMAASILTAAFIAANALFCADAAMEATTPDFPTEMLAGRSGGSGGGRVSRAPPRARSAPIRTRTIERTTIIQPAPVYSSPSVVVSPFGYNPFGGFGMGYGLGAIGNIGNEIRDSRQESEIQRSQAELDQACQREAELDSRIRQLEAAQAAQQSALAK
eukprot:CAMPEP_0202507172 /NCGR_PEP_ID=MMETSP1361-20130828/51582_1 /ASSEMBLY_ACC=CAM_ASM_000849 /TAXON_ID=210615 /ORGANISM="Staurosira complex sp., Strain CCMP2646" /LENGTH=194 /DNA_ID=CAMNT_0049141277 /DNA_START=846 /DNA_END=1430 /DNA_ORIENTATION=-